MTRNSRIEWTDHTFNPWVGCTKISPGCDHCYAETWAKRSGMVEWGGTRRRTSTANWKQPRRWNAETSAAGRRVRVFCASLADVFDNEVPREWRADLFRLIRETPHLNWLLLTKRIGNAGRMIQDALDSAHLLTSREPLWPWPNVWIGATIVNQEEADRDIPKLLATPAAVRFLSCEPLLGPVSIGDAMLNYCGPTPAGSQRMIDWVIAGGESGHHARPMHPDWARSLRDQCIAADVPFHFKQWGEWAHVAMETHLYERQLVPDQLGGHFAMWRVGKKAAGRKLDGHTWDQFPRVAA